MYSCTPNVLLTSDYIYIPKEKDANVTFQKKYWILLAFITSIIFLFILNLYFSLTSLKMKDLEELLAPLFLVRPSAGNLEKSILSNGSDHLTFLPYQRVIWISVASIAGAILLSLSGNISQALLQNPLADSSTLGMMDGASFGIMLLKTFWDNSKDVPLYLTNFFSSLMGALSVFVLILIIFNRKIAWDKHNSCTTIILFGLVLSIFFRSVNHLLKQYNTSSVTTAYALAMGGAENIYELFPSQFIFLRYVLPITIILVIVLQKCSKNWDLIELGFEQAHSLGLNVKFWQLSGYLIILICTIISINLVGNMAFIGLLSTHIARKIFQTRKHETLIPSSAIISSLLVLLAITVNQIFTWIPSASIILAIGALSLLFLSRK